MRNNINKIFLIMFIVLFSSLGYGANKKDIKTTSPVKVQSDTMKYYGKERKSVFSGNVVAVSDNFTLTSDDVTVYLNKNMDVSKIECRGNVNFKSKDIVSISNKADVNQENELAVISGNVKVWQGENYLEGEKVFIYYEENRIVVDKGTDKRVTIIFKPGEEGSNFGSGNKKP